MSKHHFTIIVYFQDVFYYPDLILAQGWLYSLRFMKDCSKREQPFSCSAGPTRANQGTPPNGLGKSILAWCPQHLDLLLCAHNCGRCSKKTIIIKKIWITHKEDMMRFDLLVEVIAEVHIFQQKKIKFLNEVHCTTSRRVSPHTKPSISRSSRWGAHSFYCSDGTRRPCLSDWRLLQWGPLLWPPSAEPGRCANPAFHTFNTSFAVEAIKILITATAKHKGRGMFEGYPDLEIFSKY